MLIIDQKSKLLRNLIILLNLVMFFLLENLIFYLDRYIKKKKSEFQDTRSNENMERLKNDLYNLQNIMSQNIDLILDRDKNLNSF